MALLCSFVNHCWFSDTLCDCETDCCVTVWIALLYHVRLPQADCMRREETCQGGTDPGSDGALTCHRSHHPFQGHHLPSGSLCHCESALTSNLWRAAKDPPWLFLLSLITAIRVWKLDCVVLNVTMWYKCISKTTGFYSTHTWKGTPLFLSSHHIWTCKVVEYCTICSTEDYHMRAQKGLMFWRDRKHQRR